MRTTLAAAACSAKFACVALQHCFAAAVDAKRVSALLRDVKHCLAVEAHSMYRAAASASSSAETSAEAPAEWRPLT